MRMPFPARASACVLAHAGVMALAQAVTLALVHAAILTLAPAAQASGWSAEVTGAIGGPSSPELFRAGWGRGLGIGGGVYYDFDFLDLCVQGDFTQFTFDGYEGLGTLGGERRISRLSLAARVHLWTNASQGRERLSLEGSGGWGHQTVASTFGEGGTTADQDLFGDGKDDGLAITGAVEFSRSLYRTTRWSAGVRYTHLRFDAESPAHVAFIMGLRMPLSGSRPQ